MLWYIKKGDRLVKVTRRSPPYRMLQKQRSILITDSAAQPERPFQVLCKLKKLI